MSKLILLCCTLFIIITFSIIFIVLDLFSTALLENLPFGWAVSGVIQNLAPLIIFIPFIILMTKFNVLRHSCSVCSSHMIGFEGIRTRIDEPQDFPNVVLLGAAFYLGSIYIW